MKIINYCMMSIFLCFLLMVSLIAGKCPSIRAETIQENDSRLEKALLAEDWKKVADLLGSVDAETPSPVLRLIKGHACLVLNRNNESYHLFLSVLNNEELYAWKSWSQNVANQNPKNAITCYLLGDALVRLKEYDLALSMFNMGLNMHKIDHLILNARGGLFVAKGQLDHALLDFVKASRLNPSLADAHASLGAIWIHRKASPQEAVESFNKALELSPDFALALNGRACAQFALGHWGEVINDLESAYERANWFSMPIANMAIFGHMKEELMVPIGNKQTKLKPGMATEVVVKYVESLSNTDARMDYVKVLENLKRTEHFKKVGKILSDFPGRKSPELFKEILILLDRLNELLKRKRNASPEEKEEIEKEIQDIYERLKDLCNQEGRISPLPPIQEEEKSENKQSDKIKQKTEKNNKLYLKEDGESSDDEQEVLIKKLEKELEWLYTHGLGRSDRAKYIKNLLEAYKKWRNQGKPKPGATPKPGKNPKSVINPVIILVGDGGVEVIPGPMDDVGSKKKPYITMFFINQFEAEVEKENIFLKDFIKLIEVAHPSVVKRDPKGIDYEDIIRSFIDKGKWLSTEMGLGYSSRLLNMSVE